MPTRKLIFICIFILLIFIFNYIFSRDTGSKKFDGYRAYNDVITQLSFGPRVMGSSAHKKEIEFILSSLQAAGWRTRVQATSWNGLFIQNIIAYRGDEEKAPVILLGTHYDTRSISDQELSSDSLAPVPGANDGASGVAVLLELARCLPKYEIPMWFVFFDAEDTAGIDGLKGIQGSRAFIDHLISFPQYVVIIDMIGDKDLNIYMELNSDPHLTQEIWEYAHALDYNQFIPDSKYTIVDDHIPFIEKEIPSTLIIDFDYPFWHTTYDTADKVSALSLSVVGETLLSWILDQPFLP